MFSKHISKFFKYIFSSQSGNNAWENLSRRRSSQLCLDPKKEKWTDISNVHTAYCQSSIEAVVRMLNSFRKQKGKSELSVYFNTGKEQSEVFDSRTLVAEIYIVGDSGFPSKIRVTNYGLSEDEVRLFGLVKDSRNDFKNWVLTFEIKKPT